MPKNIIISNPENLEKIKKAISEAGTEKIHVIADFDRTLTKAFVNDKKIFSILSILRDGNYLTQDYALKAHELFNKYHPIEIDSKISINEKKKAMREWWISHFNLLIKSGLNKKDIKKVVESGNSKLREGVLEFLDFLHEKKIPLIIMSSSGLGIESIKIYLENEGKLYDNIHIISNTFEWDEKGKAISFKEPILHGMNKDETVIHDFPFFDLIKNRKNVVLLGDSLGDVGMVKGFDYENLIKIGFLNEEAEKNLEAFKENYDVVLLNDSNMDYINELLKEITS
ncbi:hypothetical protein K8R47_00160 [archaeon]|nr:hypothetical protein [archaeon]